MTGLYDQLSKLARFILATKSTRIFDGRIIFESIENQSKVDLPDGMFPSIDGSHFDYTTDCCDCYQTNNDGLHYGTTQVINLVNGILPNKDCVKNGHIYPESESIKNLKHVLYKSLLCETVISKCFELDKPKRKCNNNMTWAPDGIYTDETGKKYIIEVKYTNIKKNYNYKFPDQKDLLQILYYQIQEEHISNNKIEGAIYIKFHNQSKEIYITRFNDNDKIPYNIIFKSIENFDEEIFKVGTRISEVKDAFKKRINFLRQ
jgi:hypothetical protein